MLTFLLLVLLVITFSFYVMNFIYVMYLFVRKFKPSSIMYMLFKIIR